MKSMLARPPLPPTATDADDTRIAIERLESEAQTHDDGSNESEKEQPVVPSDSCLKENCVKTTAGLWIDHRKAVIVMVSAKGEGTLEIRSNVEKQPGRFAGVRSTTHYGQQVRAADSRERKFTGHLNQFYAAVIAAIRDAESILIFGPGEAKGELKKRLERDELGGHIVAMETADKMTDRQVAAKVREYFHK